MIVHAAPVEGASVTGCCGRPRDGVAVGDRFTHLPERVTCRPGPTVAQLLDFEARWGLEHNGRKDEAIRAELAVTPPRFYVLLARAARSREGLEHDPRLCHALQALSDQARAVRASRFGLTPTTTKDLA